MGAAAVPAAEAAGRPKRLYVGRGDSLAFGIGASDPATKRHVGQLAQALQGGGRWQVDRGRNVSVPVNETSASIPRKQLSDSLSAILGGRPGGVDLPQAVAGRGTGGRMG